MNGKFILDTRKNCITKKGFPISIYLTQNGQMIVRTGYHAFKEHWDKANALPKKSHPNYINIINYLSKKKIVLAQLLDKANNESINLDYAKKFLLSNDTDIFYDQAMSLIKSKTELSATVLRSFNSHYPSYTFSQITKKITMEYMDSLLTIPKPNGSYRSPNGVHSYMRSLTALWNKLDKPNNPFSKVRPELIPTRSRSLLDSDIIKLRDTCFLRKRFDRMNPTHRHTNLYRMYWLLMFYLGGVNMKVLANARYDKNVIGGRFEFRRDKGNSNELCSNFIFPQAQELLDQINNLTDCYPYFTPIYKNKNYRDFLSNYIERFSKQCEPLGLSQRPTTYTARYTFINRAKQLGVDRLITEEIVGHKNKEVHSIYTDKFSFEVRDLAHKKIITL